jgi:uncharacterized protein
MRIINTIAYILVIVGGINWGLVGLLNLDLVAAIFGEMTNATRVVYCLVGLAAIWTAIALLTPRVHSEAVVRDRVP